MAAADGGVCAAGIPMAVVNARVSDRSFPRYMRLRAALAAAAGEDFAVSGAERGDGGAVGEDGGCGGAGEGDGEFEV